MCLCTFWADKSENDFIQNRQIDSAGCTLKTEYTIASQDVRNCGAMQQIRHDCLFLYGMKSEEALCNVEAKARAGNIGVGVE